VLTSDHPGAVLAGGAGADTLNASQGADRLTGAAGADVFAFKAMPWSAGHITDFQVGVDKLDLTALYMGGYRGSDPVADGYVSFVSDGAGGTKVLLDPDGHGTAQAWPFTVVTLDGVSASGLTAAQVFNGAGAPATSPQPPPPSAGGVVLTAAYPGANLAGGTGADTLNASQGSGQLTGGAGADVFAFKAMPWSAGHITDFQVGVDKLDLSALYLGGSRGRDPVADGYVSFVSDGMGGTKVLLDPDGRGTAQAWPFTVVTLDGVSANGLTAAQVFNGAGAPATTPSTTGVVLTSPYPGASLAGGAGADTLNASQGSDQLAGGAGADHFVFGALPWSAGHITDFQHGVDVLDLRPLFAAAGYQGGDPIADGYLRLEADGAGGTRVLFDRDGWGSGNPWPTTITTLDHVAPSTVTSADWLFH
jgi:Ca2+-binding RTX toxin-like protein